MGAPCQCPAEIVTWHFSPRSSECSHPSNTCSSWQLHKMHGRWYIFLLGMGGQTHRMKPHLSHPEPKAPAHLLLRCRAGTTGLSRSAVSLRVPAGMPPLVCFNSGADVFTKSFTTFLSTSLGQAW